MPPLFLFHRRWNIGTDDFVYICMLEFSIQFSIFVIYLYYFKYYEIIMKYNTLQKSLYFGLGLTITCHLIAIVVLMVISSQGMIMNKIKRKKVPHCIYTKIFLLFGQVIISVCGYALTFKKDLWNSFLYKITFFSFTTLLSIYLLLFYIYWDKTEKKKVNEKILNEAFNLEKKKKIWKNRLQCLLCLWKPNQIKQNALNTVSNILSIFTEDLNLVYSDYVAGFRLLSLQDKNMDNLQDYFLKINEKTFQPNDNVSFTERENFTIIPNVSSLKSDCSVELENSFSANFVKMKSKIKCSYNAGDSYCCAKLKSNEIILNNFKPQISISNISDWRDLRLIYYFSIMAKASYGWPLHLLFRNKTNSAINSCLGSCCRHITSCMCSNCYCCKHELNGTEDQLIVYSKGKFCSCHLKAILNDTHLKSENLICVSFYNKIHHSPFFVAISHEMQIVILSVRGTFSLNDILTDMDANLVPFKDDHLSKCCAHSGIVNAALHISKLLKDQNIIHKLMNDHKNYRIIFTGHSLGASIAVTLSCLYYLEYPNLKCYAFSPPLGGFNNNMADYCKDFVITIVNGYEWIPRLSIQSIVAVKDRIISSINKYPHSKFRLSTQKLFSCRCLACKKLFFKWNILNVFKREIGFQKNIDIIYKLPGQIIHLTNIKTLKDSNKSKLCGNKCHYTPIITSSKQFNSLLFHSNMFTDHFPHNTVNKLFAILKDNQITFPLCHHFLKHYWPEKNAADAMKLPRLHALEYGYGYKEDYTIHLSKHFGFSRKNSSRTEHSSQKSPFEKFNLCVDSDVCLHKTTCVITVV